jgi:hypothetical protein
MPLARGGMLLLDDQPAAVLALTCIGNPFAGRKVMR